MILFTDKSWRLAISSIVIDMVLSLIETHLLLLLYADHIEIVAILVSIRST